MTRSSDFTLALTFLVGLSALGCHPTETRAALGFTCPQAGAAVFVDGRYLGTVRTLRNRYVLLKPGVHRLELRLEGYYPRYRVIRLAPGETGILKVRLLPRLRWVPRRRRATRRRPRP